MGLFPLFKVHNGSSLDPKRKGTKLTQCSPLFKGNIHRFLQWKCNKRLPYQALAHKKNSLLCIVLSSVIAVWAISAFWAESLTWCSQTDFIYHLTGSSLFFWSKGKGGTAVMRQFFLKCQTLFPALRIDIFFTYWHKKVKRKNRLRKVKHFVCCSFWGPKRERKSNTVLP